MAELNQEVADRVRQELTGNPELGSGHLFGMAKEMDPSLESLSVQQFHGRYVLPVRRDQAAQREQSGEAKPRKQPRKARASKRAAKQPAQQSAGTEDTSSESEPTAEARPPKVRGKGAARSPRKSAKTARAGGDQGAAQQPTEAAQQATPEAAPAEPTVGREQVRAVFLQFARDFAEAESRTEIVQVLSKLDEYVDRVVPQGR